MKEKMYTIDKFGLDAISNEDWKDAEGVEHVGTNGALAKRDYSIPCKVHHKIGVVWGYWIWWCSTHHQLEERCTLERTRLTK